MARKQTRSQPTIEAILEGAEAVLVRDGFARATIQSIARESGVGTGAIYHHFSDKDQLFAELFKREIEGPLSRMREAMQALPASWTFLQGAYALIKVVFDGSVGKSALRRIIDQEGPRFGTIEKRLEVEDALRQVLRAFLERHRNELVVEDLELASFLIVNSVRHSIRTACDYRTEFVPNDRLVNGLNEMVARYLTGKTAVARAQAYPAGKPSGE